MAMSKDDILEAIANMTVLEVSELISAMEEKFGVTAAAPVAVAAAVRLLLPLTKKKSRPNLM
jgi:large subunit ribosomal protein L7/L12